MKKIAKIALGAALAAGVALSAAPPANAGVAVGIGIGAPVYGPGWGWRHRHWCYYHPAACHGGVYVGGPAIGVFYGGRGWWDGHRYWGHRYWFHGGWRYR